MKNIIYLAIIVLLTGCATTNSFSGPGYGEYQGSYKELKVISKNNDLYLEKLDGTESKRITHTPNIWENASFISDGKYIIYMEKHGWPIFKYFIIPSDSDDKQRKELGAEEYKSLLFEAARKEDKW